MDLVCDRDVDIICQLMRWASLQQSVSFLLVSFLLVVVCVGSGTLLAGEKSSSSVLAGVGKVVDYDAGNREDGSSSDEESKIDLGVPPVLLWEQVVKPFRDHHYVVRIHFLASLTGYSGSNSIPFVVDRRSETPMILHPLVRVGVPNRPHGPPSVV